MVNTTRLIHQIPIHMLVFGVAAGPLPAAILNGYRHFEQGFMAIQNCYYQVLLCHSLVRSVFLFAIVQQLYFDGKARQRQFFLPGQNHSFCSNDPAINV
ncbi:hypothetical protein [Foetidibacter luteolus]|uniref:hypothetical protein n=1 Tax=Foetidibacter luteolus TaxID=2608880 RepID=UPI00129A829A|nr:hypothetical protein [Foetidibacter luteolus]